MAPSGIEVLLRWFQVFVGLAFPIAVTVILWLAWRDFHRWVDHQVDAGEADDKLEKQVQEFVE